MDRTTAALTLGLALSAGCADPVIVTGEAPGVMRVVAGIPDSIGSRVDSLARRSRLNEPGAAVFDETTGVLYIADRGANITSGGTTRRVARILAVRSDGRMSVVLDGSKCPGSACPEAVHSMVIAPDGALILSDVTGHRLFRMSNNGPLEVLAGNGVAGDTGDGLPARGASIRAPAGIAFAEDGRLFFSERLGHRIRSIDAAGMLNTVAGTGLAGLNGDDGAATAASLNGPSGLARSGDVLFVADRLNGRVRAISLTTGTIRTVAGTTPGGFGGDGAPATAARLDRPESLSVSADRRVLYVADSGNHRVRSVHLETGTIVTTAGTGSTAYNGERRAAGDTALQTPSGLATSSSGFLFIVDTGHSAVWRTLATF